MSNSRMSWWNYKSIEEALSNLVNLIDLELIIEDGEIGDSGGIIIGNKIVNLSNL